ncbi:MAG TPA: hypothetical protein VFT72_18090 [Opitutaceae bacterium]|nr:hypothetical protein [Opitutaceae bacterium]
MTKIAIIAALAGEVQPLVRGWRHEMRGDVPLWFEQRGDQHRVAAFGGIGVAAAARALAAIEHDGPAHRIISIGWTGALRHEHAPGEAFRVAAVIDAATGERFSCAYQRGPDDALEQIPLVLATLARFANPPEKRELLEKYGADFVDMEAAGLARIAAARGIPFACVKAVSDGPAEPLPDFSRFIDARGQLQVARFSAYALTRPWYLPALIRLGKQSKKAALSLRSSLLAILENVATATP